LTPNERKQSTMGEALTHSSSNIDSLIAIIQIETIMCFLASEPDIGNIQI
jgi:hypothetical protein